MRLSDFLKRKVKKISNKAYALSDPFWSPDYSERTYVLRHVRPSVRSLVHLFVRIYLGIHSLKFSEILHEVVFSSRLKSDILRFLIKIFCAPRG